MNYIKDVNFAPKKIEQIETIVSVHMDLKNVDVSDVVVRVFVSISEGE